MYATIKTYAGKRAAITDPVVVGTKYGPRAGLISSISEAGDIFIFVPSIGANGLHEGAMKGYTFIETKTEQEVEALRELQWTWPVKV